MDELPLEILFMIFSHLKHRDKVLSKHVCTTWHSLLKGNYKLTTKNFSDRLALLEWAKLNNIRWHTWTCTSVIKYGDIDCLEWCEKQSISALNYLKDRPNNFGQITIGWLMGHREFFGTCFCSIVDDEIIPWNETVAAIAAYRGKLDMLKWLRSRKCPWDARTCAYAAEANHLEVLKYARSEGCPWDDLMYLNAKKYSSKHIIDYLKDSI